MYTNNEQTHVCMYVLKNTCKQKDQTVNKGFSSCWECAWVIVIFLSVFLSFVNFL